jgi:prepilin-type processing-associated H-X9-DG protein
MKKPLLLAFLLAFTLPALAQRTEIDNHNYYNYYVGPTSMKGDMVGAMGKLKSRRLNTNWLRWDDITPILVEEMTKAGYDQVYTNKLFHIDSAQYVLLAALSMRGPNVGFLYADGHAAFPTASDRQPGHQLMGDGKYDYVQMVSTPANRAELIKIRKLPANLVALQENWYWYQYTDNPSDNKYLLTKEDIIRVLREDIQEKLATAPKPSKQ